MKETDMVDPPTVAVDHEEEDVTMTDMVLLHPDSLADHLAQADPHLNMAVASQSISHHLMQETEGEDVPLDVMMVLQV